ncbi:MAG: hypothetical protein ABSA23_16110 [Anaerolineales bacterium]|jgi:hypothetical protein
MRTRLWIGLATATLFFVLVVFDCLDVAAVGDTPPGPDRFAIILEKYTSYEWWLTSWTDNTVICVIDIDHDGLPTGGDIFNVCGQDIYDEWIITQPCPQGGTCEGYYLQFVKSFPAQRKVSVQQPPPVVWVTLNGCVPYQSTFRCDSLPTLVLTGEEPIQGEHITGLAGNIDGKPFTCDPVCQVDLVPTDDNGSTLQFWAYSSYGDSSEVFQARVRVAKSSDPSDQAWYTDVLSSQWRGDTLAGCSQIWDKFPPVGGSADWLTTPQRPEDLVTNVSYEYLAAALIKHNVVNASACDAGGLLGNGLANSCGLEAARPAVDDWQNRFDALIFSAARQTGIPALLLKKIFARESQFWPGTNVGHPEAGLGQMTDGGADAVLTWNPSFYEQFCPSVLDQSVCKTKIYPNPEDEWQGIALDETDRSLLRGALVNSVNAICPDCSMGIDMGKAENSVGVFAQTLLASCKQTGEVININYGSAPGDAASYEDLWRFTLVDYNAGPGCLGLAVDKTSSSGDPLDWEHLSTHLTPACQGANEYVNDISRPALLPIPTTNSTEAPTEIATEIATEIPIENATEVPTISQPENENILVTETPSP